MLKQLEEAKIQKERQILNQQIQEALAQEALASRETQDIRNYFVDLSNMRVFDVHSHYRNKIDSLYYNYTDTCSYPFCKLLLENLSIRTYIDFYLEPVDEEPIINGIDFNKAFAMVQIRNYHKNNCVRILFNKKNKQTAQVFSMLNCQWKDEQKFILNSAEIVSHFPAVLDMIATPAINFIIQEFLATVETRLSEKGVNASSFLN